MPSNQVDAHTLLLRAVLLAGGLIMALLVGCAEAAAPTAGAEPMPAPEPGAAAGAPAATLVAAGAPGMAPTAAAQATVPATGAAAEGAPILLWPSGAPGARGTRPGDQPALTPYLPEHPIAGRPAVVICPGGGYATLAPYEGHDYAVFLREHGVAAFVLRYRLGSQGYRHPAMLQDLSRAVRLVRARATEWGVDPTHVGVMGSSAGGHLAATLMTHHAAGDPRAVDPVERRDSRPDFGVLCYPVISMGPLGHPGSRRQLLGDAPTEELVHALSLDEQVRADTPPAFIWHTSEDTLVPVDNSLLFAAALRRAGVRFALHIYQRGRHGIGLGRDPVTGRLHPWTGELMLWMRESGWLPR